LAAEVVYKYAMPDHDRLSSPANSQRPSNSRKDFSPLSLPNPSLANPFKSTKESLDSNSPPGSLHNCALSTSVVLLEEEVGVRRCIPIDRRCSLSIHLIAQSNVISDPTVVDPPNRRSLTATPVLRQSRASCCSDTDRIASNVASIKGRAKWGLQERSLLSKRIRRLNLGRRL